ncbi:MAG: GNAT family N-acetyltransferase [Candidatus Abyssobacteria bacterium SURF_5]|uniref:GNAT family N-acetyltransferase n=1 Tax=Abyssobacteria bacterium (strain SURF_5) TaxID=2093360 RepID=A0A3A4NHL8_ABYX5|nr:MAG: GNAT family N-acetyltransferase [Candidatus Abyssubacteria bacterium SURF_5]
MAKRTEQKAGFSFDGPRSVKAAEHASAIDLLNRTLRPGGPPSILQEYPLVLSERNLRNMRVIVHDGRVVSHAAVYFSNLRTQDAILRVGCIGSVATDPEYRGRGLASRVVGDCLDLMREAGCHVAVLWTQRHSFYRRLGLEAAGSEYLFRLTIADIADEPLCRVAPYDPKHLAGIMRIHEGESLRTERSRREYEEYFSIPKARTLVGLRGDLVTAYAVLGKGEDFKGCVHEWGGDPADLFHLVRKLAVSAGLKEVLILAPAAVNPFVDVLMSKRVPYLLEHLAMMKVIDAAALSRVVDSYFFPQASSHFGIISDDRGIWIHVGKEGAHLERENMLVRLMFGPERASGILKAAPPDMIRTLERFFPIPLFIWGLDSV